MSRPDSRIEHATAHIPADSQLLSVDLGAWAGEGLARAGRRDALLGRVEVLRLAADGGSIEARVRGNRPLPYHVEIWAKKDGVGCRCTCAGSRRIACRHAVASLEALRFPRSAAAEARPRTGAGRLGRGKGRIVQHAGSGSGFLVVGGPERTMHREERVALARGDELATRRQRARREKARVRSLPEGAGPPRFEVEDLREGAVHEVTLRDRGGELSGCTCTDFTENELRTCKHIERARSWYSRKKKHFPEDRVTLWCQPRQWIRRLPEPLREIRVDLPGTPGDVSPLSEFFDERGWLRKPADDVSPGDWIGRATERAREFAGQAGFGFDLDGAVSSRAAAAAADWEVGRKLASIRDEGPEWESLVAGLGFRMHRYQERGAVFLARTGRAFLADDMGLGKTLQAIVAALLLRRVVGARKALVVCPASLKHQWRDEIERACGEQATVVEGPRSKRLEAYSSWACGILVLNYELVLRDLDAIRAANADLVVLDEAQRIKNWDTKTARAVKQLSSPYAFILTGTPLENRLVELHSLVEFLYPRALGPRWRMLPFHAVTESQGRVVAYEGLDVLRRRLDGFFLRRDRHEVLDQLPERTENTFWTGMTPAQRKPYRRHAATVAALVSRGQPLRPTDIRVLLQALTQMRILCNAGAQYAWDDHAERLRDPTPPSRSDLKALQSPKLEEFARVLEDLFQDTDQKIVVFSQWERALRLAHYAVRGLLSGRDLRAEVFHGGLVSKARGDMLEAFRTDPEFRVLFSTDAGGLGLNLQKSASIVINLEVPWNPAVLEQRIGRVHRMGQRRSVQVLHFVTRGALEDRVRQVLQDKQALFDGLLVHGADRVVLEERSRKSFVRRISELVEGGEESSPPIT